MVRIISPSLLICAWAQGRTYTKHAGLDCYYGYGGLPMDATDTTIENTTVADCEAICDRTKHCVAITHDAESWFKRKGGCWLRSAVELSKCERSVPNWDTYTAGPAPTPVPAPTPRPTPAPRPTTYNESQALIYAYMSTAAMCSYPHVENTKLLRWSCGAACDAVPGMTNVFVVNATRDDAFVYGGTLNGQCTIVFRGTTNIAGWIQDLQSSHLVKLEDSGIPCSHNGSPCQVGKGFLQNYEALAEGIKHNLRKLKCRTLAVSGHSLGAAEAAIAMLDLKQQGYDISEAYTFGQPRVGNAAFAEAFRIEFGSTAYFRVTHADDPITQVPVTDANDQTLRFQHVPTEVYYKKDVGHGHKICDGSGEDVSCADSRAGDFFHAGFVCATSKSKCSHLTYMMPLKSILMDGSSCATSSASLI